jgi:hypothetical protein
MWVTIRLADPGASIKTEEFELKGNGSQVLKETDLVKTYRKKGIIKTEPAAAPKKDKKSTDEKSEDQK